MVEILTNMINREWNLINTDADDYYGASNSNTHSHHSRLLSKKISDNNSNNQYDQTINVYNDISSLVPIRPPKPLSNHMSLDKAYDTDGAIGTSTNRSKHRHNITTADNNYEYLISPKLSSRRHGTQPVKVVTSIPLQQRLSHKMHLTAPPSLNTSQNHIDRNDDSNYEDAAQHRHIRLSRRVRQIPTPVGNHGAGARPIRSTALVQHNSQLPPTPSIQPLRIIFMRHSERANQALGPDWFLKAFRTNKYKAYDQNLPSILPKRRFDQAYEFDPPLTGE